MTWGPKNQTGVGGGSRAIPRLCGKPGLKGEALRKNTALDFDPQAFLTRIESGKTTRQYRSRQVVFSQGDAADAVFYIQSGKVKLTVVSTRGKEAVIGVLEQGSFFGEGCLAGQPLRMSTGERDAVVQHRPREQEHHGRPAPQEPEFAELFIAYLLSRNVRMEEDLVDQLFNSSEKRLARVLLLLAHFGKESRPETVIPKVSQETLAAMIGTTRSRVSFFMNRFRKLGFIHYNGGLQVHSALLTVVLRD
jgi:CRP/FNR family transcriptional regulator, cyclic AMP receptor protein